MRRLREKLEGERDRLVSLLEVHRRELGEARLAETASERLPDPATAEGGSMAFEFEKELSVDQNTEDLLLKVEHALAHHDQGEYGICESCGTAIPFARLEALLYATKCVNCAAKNR